MTGLSKRTWSPNSRVSHSNRLSIHSLAAGSHGQIGLNQPNMMVRLMLPLRELEAFAGAFSAVFFAFFHTAVAGEIAGVAELLRHTAGSSRSVGLALSGSAGGFRRSGFGAQAEHIL